MGRQPSWFAVTPVRSGYHRADARAPRRNPRCRDMTDKPFVNLTISLIAAAFAEYRQAIIEAASRS